jgi:signal transduction histidine kinase
MPEGSPTHIVALTIIITTLLLFIFGALIVRYIFIYQAKKRKHIKEIVNIEQAFAKTLLQSKLEIQEQTVDHIGKELHANIGHLASLININLATIIPQSTDDLKESLLETKLLTKQLLFELKHLSAVLNTDHIAKIGFKKSLEQELARVCKSAKIDSQIDVIGYEVNLSPEKEIILFRLCQEVLNNTLKHAEAKGIQVTLSYQKDFFEVRITDDGVGFDPLLSKEIITENKSTGIQNMKKRASLIGADFTIDSSTKSKGTKITITIPFST